MREGSPYLTLLPSSETLHIIRWCNFLPTFHVGLNFHSHHSLVSCHQHGLTWAATNVGFEILGKTEITHGLLVYY